MNKTFSRIFLIVCIVLCYLILFGAIIFSQDKPKQDSTMFKFWIEKYNTSIFELAQIDTFKIEKTGEIKFIVRQAQEEQRKLNEKR